MNYNIISINTEIEKKSQMDIYSIEDENYMMEIFYQLSFM